MIRKINVDELPSIVERSSMKAKMVKFYKNGDKNFPACNIPVSSTRFNNFENLLNELTRVTDIPKGVRCVFTPQNGSRISSLDQLINGKAYVCDSCSKLKKMDYDKIPSRSQKKREKKWKSRRGVAPVNISRRINLMEPQTEKDNFKPKFITVFRNALNKPTRSTKMLLNKRTAPTYERLLDNITIAIDSDVSIRCLFDLTGKRVYHLCEIFNDGSIFIAVGKERMTREFLEVIRGIRGKGQRNYNNEINSDTLNSATSSIKLLNQQIPSNKAKSREMAENSHKVLQYTPKNTANIKKKEKYKEMHPTSDVEYKLRKDAERFLHDLRHKYRTFPRQLRLDQEVLNRETINRYQPLPSISRPNDEPAANESYSQNIPILGNHYKELSDPPNSHLLNIPVNNDYLEKRAHFDGAATSKKVNSTDINSYSTRKEVQEPNECEALQGLTVAYLEDNRVASQDKRIPNTEKGGDEKDPILSDDICSPSRAPHSLNVECYDEIAMQQSFETMTTTCNDKNTADKNDNINTTENKRFVSDIGYLDKQIEIKCKNGDEKVSSSIQKKGDIDLGYETDTLKKESEANIEVIDDERTKLKASILEMLEILQTKMAEYGTENIEKEITVSDNDETDIIRDDNGKAGCNEDDKTNLKNSTLEILDDLQSKIASRENENNKIESDASYDIRSGGTVILSSLNDLRRNANGSEHKPISRRKSSI